MNRGKYSATGIRTQATSLQITPCSIFFSSNFDNGYYTFLQYCADQGHDELVQFLLKKGASPNFMSKNYLIPPLVLAGHHGYYKVLKIFKSNQPAAF